MPRPALRSRSLRRTKKNTPGGRSKIHYSKPKPSPAVCALCKGRLSGVPKKLPYQMKRLPKTKKRPESPFGGHLCSKCLRESIKSSIHLR